MSETKTPPSDVRWTLSALGEEPAEWWRTWDALNDTNNDSHPLLSASMAGLLLRFFGNRQIRFAALRSGDRIVAQAIIELSGIGRWRVFCPPQSPIALIVVDRSLGPMREYMRLLLRAAGPLAMQLDVPLLDGPYLLLSATNSGLVVSSVWGTTTSIRNGGDFDRYWSARPSSLRHNIRRFERRSEKVLRGARLVRLETPGDVIAAVDSYGRLESQGWKGHAGTALHPDNHQGMFYRNLMQAFAIRRMARVYELWIGGDLAASRLLIGGGGMLVILKTTYDESLRALAPGRLLAYYLLRDIMSSKKDSRVEFYTRASADTLKWATDVREIRDVTIYRNHAVACAALVRRHIWSTGRRAKSQEPEAAADTATSNA